MAKERSANRQQKDEALSAFLTRGAGPIISVVFLALFVVCLILAAVTGWF